MVIRYIKGKGIYGETVANPTDPTVQEALFLLLSVSHITEKTAVGLSKLGHTFEEVVDLETAPRLLSL